MRAYGLVRARTSELALVVGCDRHIGHRGTQGLFAALLPGVVLVVSDDEDVRAVLALQLFDQPLAGQFTELTGVVSDERGVVRIFSFLTKNTLISGSEFCWVPPAGFEPALPPPEGGALSPELRGPGPAKGDVVR